VLAPAALADEDKMALAARMQIAGQLQWKPSAPVSGQVNLEGTTVAALEDEWTEKDNGYWPVDGRLRLDGFTYGRFGGDKQATVEQRLKWICGQYQQRAGGNPTNFAARLEQLLRIRSQHPPRSEDNFATQPYEQLAAVYQRAGQDERARKVAIARRADLRKYGDLKPYRWLSNWFLDWSIKYGYQTWRAGVGLAALFAVFLVLSIVGQHQHVIVPVGDTKGLHYLPSVAECTGDYPCFYPAGYTIDKVIPIINVHQADFWGPDGHAPWGWFWVGQTWVATTAGWALATLLVAGYTGLVRRD